MNIKTICFIGLSIFFLSDTALMAQKSGDSLGSNKMLKVKVDSSSLSIRKNIRSGKGSQPTLEKQTEFQLGNSQPLNMRILPDTTNKNLHFNSDTQKSLEINRKDCLVL